MKIGDYVRTKNGIIGRIETKNYIGYSDWLIDTLYYNDDEIINDWTCGIKEYDIIKSSSNIIDLIQVGDVLTIKHFVDEACEIFTDIYLIQNENQLFNIKDDLEKNKNKKIYSILTKEQFESMEYKVGE